jgi:hypothetical protein
VHHHEIQRASGGPKEPDASISAELASRKGADAGGK